MNKLLTIDEIKQTELSILDYIDCVCKQHNIRYYLAYGTLLGAIRHKGFIPWDDDIDIYMLREDYDRFIKLLSAEKDNHYSILSIYNDSDYFYEFAKVVDNRTCVITENVKENHNEGVWVDIFPLDDAPKFLRMTKWLINIIVAFRILSVYESFPYEKRSWVLYPMWFLSRLFGSRFFLKLSDYIVKSGKSNDYVGYMCSMGVSKYFFSKHWCDDTILVNFEGENYPAFKHFDDYLKYQYGNYMQLPPEDKRIPHPIKAFWRDDK